MSRPRRNRLLRLRRVQASAVAAVVIVLFVAFVLLQTIGSSSVTISTVSGGGVPHARLAAVRVGETKGDVERAIGRGRTALGRDLVYEGTGVAVEPMDASCTYYDQHGVRARDALAQLCFRDGKLVSKRTFPASPGPVWP